MTNDVQKFKDPELKEAIRQVNDMSGASPELVDRVRAALARDRAAENGDEISTRRMPLTDIVAGKLQPGLAVGEKVGDGSDQVIGPFRSGSKKTPMHPMRKFITALAAILLVTIGGAKIYLAWREADAVTKPLYGHEELLAAMVKVHDAGPAGAADFKPLIAPLTDPVALAKEATEKLGRPVPDLDLSKKGWSLDGASLCSIDGSPSARFHYTGNGKSITLVSLPATALGPVDAPNYEATSGPYPISGYIDGKSLNCVVGDPSMTMPEVTALRETVKG